MMCPGCNNPTSEMERLTGLCSKDGESIHSPRDEFTVFLQENANSVLLDESDHGPGCAGYQTDDVSDCDCG